MHRYLPCLFLCMCVCTANAQSPAAVWQKDVSRIVTVESGKASDLNKDNLITEMLHAVKANEVKAYTNANHDFKTTIDYRKAMEVYNSTGDGPKAQAKKYAKDSSATEKIKLKILEHWMFNPISGRAEIQIAGIAPVGDIYNRDGSYRASRALFWLSYADAKKIMNQYESKHPNTNIMTKLWEDQASFDHTIDIAAESDITEHHVQDESSDSTLFETIVVNVNNGNINAYRANDTGFSQALTKAAFQHLFANHIDTVAVEDPVSKTKVLKISKANYDYSLIHLYKISGNTFFNNNTGTTTIEITGILPSWDVNAVVRIKYADMEKITGLYDEYHPQHTLASYIWNNFFE